MVPFKVWAVSRVDAVNNIFAKLGSSDNWIEYSSAFAVFLHNNLTIFDRLVFCVAEINCVLAGAVVKVAKLAGPLQGPKEPSLFFTLTRQ